MFRTPQVRTARLLLRGWREADLEPFAALNADPEVRAYLQGPISRAQSDAAAHAIEADFERHGWGLWAVEVVETGTFVGFVGLAEATFSAPFTPTVEIGWRLAREAWGHGYATEAARVAVAFGFQEAELPEILSFTSTLNQPSRAVMERLGMRRDPDGDFDHPLVPEGDPIRPHVLYRFTPEARAALLLSSSERTPVHPEG